MKLFALGDRIQAGYIDNPYHNKIHAFDVTATVNFFLTTCELKTIANLSGIDLTVMYIGAAGHDYEHPGVNNPFLINSRGNEIFII